MQNAKLGGIQVRGGVARPQPPAADQQAALREARETYESMRKSQPADDITPELVYYAALHDFQQYDEMKVVVAEMLRKQPGSQELKDLRTWVESRGGNR
jgi:hypothetical protein